jgi:hypothetical protein
VENWGPFIQLGVGGILLLVLWLIVKGELRTTQEITTQKERTLRAEGQVDKLLPAVEQNTETLKGVVTELHTLGGVVKELLDEMRDRRQPLQELLAVYAAEKRRRREEGA